jgi:hypothetical protein
MGEKPFITSAQTPLEKALSTIIIMPTCFSERDIELNTPPGKIWVEQCTWNKELDKTVLNGSIVFSTFYRQGDRMNG